MKQKITTPEDAKTNFDVFGIPNAFFLLDDYLSKKPCITSGIVFPSVRQVVLSHKTRDIDIKNKIASATLPANLKDLEKTIVAPPYWNIEYIWNKMYWWTLCKFKLNPDLKILLKNTESINLVDTLDNRFGIEELKDIPNYRGEILMLVRKKL